MIKQCFSGGPEGIVEGWIAPVGAEIEAGLIIVPRVGQQHEAGDEAGHLSDCAIGRIGDSRVGCAWGGLVKKRKNLGSIGLAAFRNIGVLRSVTDDVDGFKSRAG